MSHYTPFQEKDISQLSSIDLEILNTVSEGWYIEYKRDLPNPKSIAKSISAFANTYGGWLFIGIAENSKSNNTAVSYPGIARNDIDAGLQKIRQSVAEHLNPTPHFEVKVIWGPNESIMLQDNYGIICIEVAQSPLAPHVHSSGCIYRRVSDLSEPKAENDRHKLELLWNRREKVNEEYRRWIEREPEQSKIEENQPYLRLLFDADLYRAKGQKWDLTINQIQEVLNDESSGPGIPVDTIYPSSLGWIARQTTNLDRHEQFGFTWVIGRGLCCEILLPINCFNVDQPNHLSVHLARHVHIGRFINMLEIKKASNSRVLDLNQLFAMLIGVSNSYLKLLTIGGHPTDKFHAKAILGGIWRTIPFLDSEIMLNRVEKFGLPLSLTSVAMVPGGSDANSFYEVKPFGTSEFHEMQYYSCAFWLFELVCTALGFQGILADGASEEAGKLFEELRGAYERTQLKKHS